MSAKTINDWADKPGLSGKGDPPVTDGVNSGGAVSKAMSDDTFGVRRGGGGGGGGASPAAGVVDTPMDKVDPGK